MMRRMTVVASILLAVSACTRGDTYLEAPQPGYVEDVDERVAAVDWSGVSTVEVALDEFAFSPEALTFERGAPYRLRLTNAGRVTHSFVAEGFFKAIAAYRLSSAAGEVSEPYLERIEVRAGITKELLFVPVEAGTFELECTVPLHAVFGMVGEITVE